MDKGKISLSQLMAVVVSVSLLPFFSFLQFSKGCAGLLVYCAAESLLMAVSPRISSLLSAKKALKTAAACYCLAAFTLAPFCFSAATEYGIDTPTPKLLAIALVGVAMRSAGSGCEAVGRFSSIALGFSAAATVLLAAFCRSYLSWPLLRESFPISPSPELAALLLLPLPALVAAELSGSCTGGPAAPARWSALLSLLIKSLLGLMLYSALGPLRGYIRAPFFYLAYAVADRFSPVLLSLVVMAFVGVAVAAMSGLLLTAARSIGRDYRRSTLLLALPAAVAALVGGAL